MKFLKGVVFLVSGLAGCTPAHACAAEDKVTELVYFEARDQDFAGQLAVATVAYNRLYSGLWGDTICDVVNAPKQFSYYSDGLPENMTDKEAEEKARQVAKCVVRWGCRLDTVGDALDYYACKGNYGISPPYWVEHYALVAEVGSHCFYSREKNTKS